MGMYCGVEGQWKIVPRYRDGHEGFARYENNDSNATQRARQILLSDPDIVRVDYVFKSYHTLETKP